MENPRIAPADARHDLPEDIARIPGGSPEDRMPWPQGGWAQVRANTRLPRRSIPKTVITLEFVVRTDGSVTDIVVVSGGPVDIAEALVEGLRQTPFDPGIKAGRPINSRLRQSMTVETKNR